MARARRNVTRPGTADPLGAGPLHTTLLRLLMVLCGLLAGVTWLTALTTAPLIPEQIPVHFGPGGTPDAYGAATGGILYALPLIATALALGMVLLYHYPRYASLPGTLLLDVLPPVERRKVTAVVQANVVPALTLANLVIAYLHYNLVAVALGNRDRLDVTLLLGLVALLLLTGAFYAIASTRMVTAILRKVRRA